MFCTFYLLKIKNIILKRKKLNFLNNLFFYVFLFCVVKENFFSYRITGDFKMFESKFSLPILHFFGYSLAVYILTQILKDLTRKR